MTNPNPTDAPAQDDESHYQWFNKNYGDHFIDNSPYIISLTAWKAALAAMPSVAQLRADKEELLDSLASIIAITVDGYGGEYDEGEIPDLDVARKVLAKHRAPERKE